MKKLIFPFLLTLLQVFLFCAESQSQIGMKKGDGGFLFVEGNRKIAFYQKEDLKLDSESGRANFLHPLYLPNGEIITENAPEDHFHHRGVFWAWHQVQIGGKSIGDPWELRDFVQDIKNVEFYRLPEETGVFKTRVLWKSSQYEDGKEAFLEEQTAITFFKLKKKQQLILFEIQLKALVEGLELGGSDDEKGYGGFSVRMKLPADVVFSGEKGGVEPQTIAIEGGKYININGSLGDLGKQAGVLIYANSQNQEKPQTWILRKEKSMQNAVFPGRKPILVSRESPIVLKYALVLYNGVINEAKLIREIESALK